MKKISNLPQVHLADVIDAYNDYIMSASDSDIFLTGWKPKNVEDFYEDEYQNVWLKGLDFSYFNDFVLDEDAAFKKNNEALLNVVDKQTLYRLKEIHNFKNPSPELQEIVATELKYDLDALFDFEKIDEKIEDVLNDYKRDNYLAYFNEKYGFEFDEIPSELVVLLHDGSCYQCVMTAENKDFPLDEDFTPVCHVKVFSPHAKSIHETYEVFKAEFPNVLEFLDYEESDDRLGYMPVTLLHSLDEFFQMNKEAYEKNSFGNKISNAKNRYLEQSKETCIPKECSERLL